MKTLTLKITKNSENLNAKNLDETQTFWYQFFVRFLIYFVTNKFHYQ